MKYLLSLALVAVFTVTASASSIVLSSSNSDPAAGLDLTIAPGDVASVYVWVTPDADQIINSLGLNIASAQAGLFSAATFSIDNPGVQAGFGPPTPRWQALSDGSFEPGSGLVVSDSQAGAVTSPGINQQALAFNADLGTVVSGAALHGTLTVTAGGAAGVATLTPEAGPFTIGDTVNNPIQGLSFSGGTITIESSTNPNIPEPTSAALLALGLAGVAARRRS